jgi:hypothetical protein
MYKFLFLPGFLILVFSLSGCDKEITFEPSTQSQKQLMPLQIGNSWNYKLYNHISDSTGIVNWTVNKKILLDSTEYYFINTAGFGNSQFLAKNVDGGLFLSMYDSLAGIKSPFFFKYPAENNEVYSYQIPGTDSILNLKVEKSTIILSGNSYKYYGYYNMNFNPYFPFMYFSEDVGLIRHKAVFASPNSIDTSKYFIYDLQNYVINK